MSAFKVNGFRTSYPKSYQAKIFLPRRMIYRYFYVIGKHGTTVDSRGGFTRLFISVRYELDFALSIVAIGLSYVGANAAVPGP